MSEYRQVILKVDNLFFIFTYIIGIFRLKTAGILRTHTVECLKKAKKRTNFNVFFVFFEKSS